MTSARREPQALAGGFDQGAQRTLGHPDIAIAGDAKLERGENECVRQALEHLARHLRLL